MNRRAPIPERTGQTFVIDSDVLLVLGPGQHPEFGPFVPAWLLLDLQTGRTMIMSEDWVSTQAKMMNLVIP